MPDEKVDEKTDKPEQVMIDKAELDDLRAAVHGMKEEIGAFRTKFNANADEPAYVETAVPQPKITVTRDMIVTANKEGNYELAAELADKMADEKVALSEWRIREQELKPARNMIVGRLADDTLDSLKSLKYYGRFEKEIKVVLNRMPNEQRANKQVVKKVYDMIVGEHLDKLQSETREETIRQSHEAGGALPDGAGRNGGGVGGGGGLSVEEAYGEDGAKDVRRILKEEGLTIDQFVVAQRRRGLTKAKDTQEYLKQVKESNEGVTA